VQKEQKKKNNYKSRNVSRSGARDRHNYKINMESIGGGVEELRIMANPLPRKAEDFA